MRLHIGKKKKSWSWRHICFPLLEGNVPRPTPCQLQHPIIAQSRWQCLEASLIPHQINGIINSLCLSHSTLGRKILREVKMHKNVKSQPSLRKLFSRWTHFTSKIFSWTAFESLVLWFHFPLSSGDTLNTHEAFSHVPHNISNTLTPGWKYILPLLLCTNFSNLCSEINPLSINAIDVFVRFLFISLQYLNILTFPEAYKVHLPVLKNQRCDPTNKRVNLIFNLFIIVFVKWEIFVSFCITWTSPSCTLILLIITFINLHFAELNLFFLVFLGKFGEFLVG